MQNIVVAFDASAAADVALDWAAERASRSPSRVEIVMVAGTVLAEDDRADPSLSRAERRVRDRAPDADITSRRCDGRMPETLLEQAIAADMIVIGSHRHRTVRSAITGWLPLRIAARSTIPVVVVPDDWTVESGPVLVGVDDDDSSAAALAFASCQAADADVALVVVHAWLMPASQQEGPVALLASPNKVKATHRSILDDAVRTVASDRPTVRIEQALVHDNPAAALLSRAADASLVVIGTHHRGILAGGFLGSVGQDVLTHSPAPVCVVPNEDAGRASEAR
ncbi:MAG: universal stress protein [Microbacterium sp.]